MPASRRRKPVFSLLNFMLKTFKILSLIYFHIQTSAIKRKYQSNTDCLHFLVSARARSISRYIYIQTFCVHNRNGLRFLRHAGNIPLGTYHVVVREGSHFCQSPKGGGSGVFFIKMQERANTFLGKKYQNSPALLPQEKTYLP